MATVTLSKCLWCGYGANSWLRGKSAFQTIIIGEHNIYCTHIIIMMYFLRMRRQLQYRFTVVAYAWGNMRGGDMVGG
jgi:hypothetical protein